MTESINICGVLIHGRPEDAAKLTERIETIPGTQVHHAADNGRMVVTVEADSERVAGDRMLELNNIEGVLSASLVYHHFEADPEARVLTGE